MPKNKPLISVVIPVFNEEPTVGNVIERTKKAIETTGLPYEILVVDDCSTDNSRRVSLKSKVKVLSLKEHMGKGCALRLGFKEAKGDIIVTMDSDGSHNPEELPKLLEPILKDEADFIIGSRFLNKENVFQKRVNKFGAQLLNFLVRILTRQNSSDSQSGYRAFKSSLLKKVNLKSNGYEIESEMLIKAIKRGFRTKEIPVKFEQRTYGKSKLDPLKDGAKIFASAIAAFIGD
ncbi:MAG: glycosyltransferase family 2 protein [Candidatus Bathyarchaeales archaeon]